MPQSESSKAAEKLANNIKILRSNNNKSVYQMSKEIGIAQGFLSDIENQKKSPSFKTLDKLADYFGVEIYELFL